MKKNSMKRTVIIGILFSVAASPDCFAQYYYKDILGSRQLAADMAILKDHKIQKVDVKSYEANEELSEGFFCQKVISRDYRKIETYTKSSSTAKSLLTTYFDDKGRLFKTVDSSEISVASSEYSYDDKGNIASITSGSRSNDDDFITSLIEVHQYQYNSDGQPKKMLLIKNKKDTTEIDFVIDSTGKVSEESEVAVFGNHYYYYYDNAGRITDIVRYNTEKKKALPDFIFQYDEDGLLSQMVTVDVGVTSDYLIWRYVYDGQLRIKEKCYSKDKKLLGYFEYEYE